MFLFGMNMRLCLNVNIVLRKLECKENYENCKKTNEIQGIANLLVRNTLVKKNKYVLHTLGFRKIQPASSNRETKNKLLNVIVLFY